jgi:hypothetical protein
LILDIIVSGSEQRCDYPVSAKAAARRLAESEFAREEPTRMKTVLLGAVICLIAAGCSSTVHHTDKKAAMARLNWTPERCETVGLAYYDCGSTHSLPDAGAGLMGAESSNDARGIRGVCSDGWTYVQGKGCQLDDK